MSVKDIPIRQRTPHPIPPAREFMRRCENCGADFLCPRCR